jgi:uncharacterized membrane protein
MRPSSAPPKPFDKQVLLFGAGLILLYALILAAKFALWRANVLVSDWAFYNNSFWYTNFRDLWLFSHDRYIQFGYPSYLNEHFAPLLLVLAALYHVVPWPEAMLLVLHGASPILATIGIYATALHLTKSRDLSILIALSYALNPGILWPTISLVYGFEPDSLLPPLAALAGWALATHRTGWFFVALFLAFGIKENVPAYGVILGVCLCLFTERRKQGLVTIVVSLIVFFIASKGVSIVTGVENRNIGVAWRFIDSLLRLQPTFDYTFIEILIGLAYSIVFLPALAVLPFMAVIGPDLLLIGQVSYAKTVTWHVMLPVTVLALGAAFGTARILTMQKWPAALDARIGRERLVRGYWTGVLVVSLIAGPLTIWVAYDRYIALRSSVDRAAIAEALATVPPGAGVVVTSDLEQYFVRFIVTSRLDVSIKAAGDFSYFVVNRRVLTDRRRNGPLAEVTKQDECFIKAAEGVARDGGKILMDKNDILVAQFVRMPPLDCR